MSKRIRRGPDLPEEFPGWLWANANLIPRHELTMIAGHDGVGKSSFALQLVAEMTVGDFSEKVETVFLSMQEDAEEVTKARLKAYGADLRQTVYQPRRENGEPDTPWAFPEDLEVFEEYLRTTKATVAVIDSLDAHISALASQRARVTLHLLRAIAKRHSVTIILVHHVNKAAKTFDQAIGGGRGVKAAMRCILVWGERPKSMREIIMGMFGKDEDDDDDEENEFEQTSHALAVHKNSYGYAFPQYKTWLYESEVIDNPYTPSHTLLKFNYSEESHVVSPTGIWQARQTEIAGESGVKKQKDIARKLILQFLAGYKDEWMPGTELLANVMTAGISQRTAERMRAELAAEAEIESQRIGGPNGFIGWRIKFNIPDEGPPDSKKE